VEGVGPLIATALVAAIGNARQFKNGRALSAWLGLVPRQHSSGRRTVLLGISKRGDRYLRTLLIHGARSATRVAERKRDARCVWVNRLKLRSGPNVAAVALANKNARVMWALLTGGQAGPRRPEKKTYGWWRTKNDARVKTTADSLRTGTSSRLRAQSAPASAGLACDRRYGSAGS
jgi:transposase